MSRYPDLPYVQGRNYGPKRNQTQLIVIHATQNTASAEAEASYASRRTDGVSSHFYTDNDSTVQSLDTAVVAYGCYPTGNSRSVQFELCGLSGKITDATMRQAAPVVARAAAEFGVPLVKVTPAQMRAGTRGICGHRDVTQAWHEGDHTDPEPFPWDTFLGYVRAAAGTPGEDADMPFATGPTELPNYPGEYRSYSIPPVNAGGLPWGRAWLSIFGDLFGTTEEPGKAMLRIAVSNGVGGWSFLGTPPAPGQEPRVLIESGKIYNVEIPGGSRGLSIMRVPVDPEDDCSGSLSMSIEYGTR